MRLRATLAIAGPRVSDYDRFQSSDQASRISSNRMGVVITNRSAVLKLNMDMPNVLRGRSMKTYIIKLVMLLSGLMLGNQAFAAHSCTPVASNTGGTFFQVDL